MEAAESKQSNGGERKVPVANERKFSCTGLVLRFLAFALTLGAAILIGVDEQTTYISMTVVPTLPPLSVPVTAKWRYLSAFVYFVVANSVACAYAAISLLITMANNGGKRRGLAVMITIFDVVIIALLFSGASAAMAIGIMGYEGNSHVQWKKVCNVFAKFCHQVAAAIALSGAGSLVFLLLALLAIWNLHKKH